jgi:hypothetical protein
MRTPKLKVREYKHKTHPFVVDLRPWGKGRASFKTREKAEEERRRQQEILKRHGYRGVGLSEQEMTDFITVRDALAEYGKTIVDAATFTIHPRAQHSPVQRDRVPTRAGND